VGRRLRPALALSFRFPGFNVFAIAYALYLSFTYFDLFSPPRWIGLGNYLYLLRDALFLQKAIPNTLKYVAVVVPVQTVISLLLAFALDQEIKFRRFFRTLFYVPSVTSSVVISLIFLWLFKKTGVINQILGLSIDWLNSPTFALPTIMIVNIWGTYYEAAMIDGANRWQMLRHITIPLLRPVIFFVVTMGVIGCFQVFDQIYVMTAGGPLDSTTTIAYLIYKWAFQSTTPFMGRASAVAFVLAGMILIVTVIQRRLIERPAEV